MKTGYHVRTVINEEHTEVSVIPTSEALQEINGAQMEKRDTVSEMSSWVRGAGTHAVIMYEDGTTVSLRPAVEAEIRQQQSHGSCVSVRGGKIHLVNPYLLQEYGEYFPLCRTGGQSSNGTIYALSSNQPNCAKCNGYI